MKLVFAKEMQSLDQQSAEQIGLPTMVLMENAGKAVAETAADFLEDCFGKNIVVFTGKGNNGGDGFAGGIGCCFDVVVTRNPLSQYLASAELNPFGVLQNFTRGT